MPKLHDARVNFSAGRTNKTLSNREAADAYSGSIYDANNMMVTSEAKLSRRWGTFIRQSLANGDRIEGWNFARIDTAQFILVFSPARLEIYDLTQALRATFTSMPWTADTIPFMSISFDKTEIIITDNSFAPKIVKLNETTGTFSQRDFAFKKTGDNQKLLAPFYQFVSDDVLFFPTIFTTEGHSAVYGSHIADVANIDWRTFSIANGTGRLTSSEDYFTPNHVGVRMRLGDGELEVTGYRGPRHVDIKVYSDLVKKLPTDPFYCREAADYIEVAAPDHGLKVGDVLLIGGVTRLSTATSPSLISRLSRCMGYARDASTITNGEDGPGPYKVLRVEDKDHFEIAIFSISAIPDPYVSFKVGIGLDATFGGSTGGNSANFDADYLLGGGDVMLFPLTGFRGLKEQVFSAERGWPQCSAVHEKRRWYGGSTSLPNAVFASAIGTTEDFDPNEGDPNDALVMLGIGEQSRVRHIVPGYDVAIMTDNGEFFIPGSPETAITQETVRAVPATNFGASYTPPIRFDGGVYFVDAIGRTIREMRPTQRGEYESPPASVVCPDWVKSPKDVTFFQGAGQFSTPLTLWANEEDGSVLVMHSSKADGFFGFMRWTIEGASIVSCAGVGSRLFALVERGADKFLVEFDALTERFITTDLTVTYGAGAGTAFVAAPHPNATLEIVQDAKLIETVTTNVSGNFTTGASIENFTAGIPMSFFADMHRARAGDGRGTNLGKIQRLVDVEIEWDGTSTGLVHGQNALSHLEAPALALPEEIEGWRKYVIGEWGDSPRLRVSGETAGLFRISAAVLNVYF